MFRKVQGKIGLPFVHRIVFMKEEDVLRIKEILDESLDWEPEVLRRMPKLFLLIRDSYIRALEESEDKQSLVQ